VREVVVIRDTVDERGSQEIMWRLRASRCEAGPTKYDRGGKSDKRTNRQEKEGTVDKRGKIRAKVRFFAMT
jgi:hypothetical protein